MSDAAVTEELSYDDTVREFLSYLTDYRSFSPLTVRAYGTDMRMLREFLKHRLGRLPSPTEITRELIVQFGVSLRKPAPLTLRRKYACISSFFGFLQDMGYAHTNPARRLPLPRVSEYVPVFLTEEMAQQLIAAADTPWTKAMVVLLLSTGIRRSEAVGITLDDLNLEERQLLIRGKGDKVCMLSSLGTRIGRHRLGLDRTLGSMAIRVSVTSGTRMGSSGYPAERKGSRRRDQTRRAARRHRSRLMEQSGGESVGGDLSIGEEAALDVRGDHLG